jgi:hypothetical protein
MDTTELIAQIDAEIARLEKVKTLLDKQTAPPRRGNPPGTKSKVASKRTLSPEARAKIAAAQKKRWAKQK